MESGVYTHMHAATVLLLVMLTLQGFPNTAYPWVYPGDFRERIKMSDLVVSGTIADTRQDETRVVDKIMLTANVADFRVDRVFQGDEPAQEFLFTFFTPYVETSGGGIIGHFTH